MFFGNVVGTGRIEHEDDRLFGGKHPKHSHETGLVGLFFEDRPAGFVAMPMAFGAIVFDEQFIERREEGHEFLQAIGDGAGRKTQIVAAQFGHDAIERLEEFELALQNQLNLPCLQVAAPSRHSLALRAHRHRLSAVARKKMSGLARQEM